MKVVTAYYSSGAVQTFTHCALILYLNRGGQVQ
jgi:hypothetical protein